MPSQLEKEQEVFENHFEEEIPEEGGPRPAYYDHISPLGIKLQGLFTQAEDERRDVEEEWLKDLRQYKGLYDPEVLARIHPKRSKAFLSVTRTKVKTVTARMMDLLFPASREKNWGIQPTPVPEINPQIKQQITEQYIAKTSKTPTEAQINDILYNFAKKSAERMEKEIADQLAELEYTKIVREVISSGNLYGTGILKGPLAQEKVAKRWFQSDAENWDSLDIKSLHPYCEFVSLWDVYLDQSAKNIEDSRYIFQRYVLPKNKVLELAERSDFKADPLTLYVKDHPTGDSEYKAFETNLSMIDGKNRVGTTIQREGYFDVLEYWGFIDVEELKNLDVDLKGIPEGATEVACNVWLLGNVVIKVVLSPISGIVFPYYTYYFDKDETSIYGQGLPYIMRDSQTLFNAAVRGMLDNAAISAGPIIEANMDLLEPDEDPTDLFPFRVFKRSGLGIESTQRAIHVETLPSYTNEFMAMTEFFLAAADETTAIPRYMAGDSTNMGGAATTASGLSMLFGAVNITLKDQVTSYDNDITKKYIRNHYFFNMEFSPKSENKGDYSVIARGSTSLVAKEVQAEHLNQFMITTNNEYDQRYVNRDVCLREFAKSLDLTEFGLIKPPEQVAHENEIRAKQNQQQQEFERELAKEKAASGGHMADKGQTPQLGTP